MTDLYILRRGWLHAVDPRIKLLFVVVLLLLLLAARNLWLMLAVLLLIHLVVLSTGIPLGKLAAVWKPIVPVALLMSVLWIIFYPSGEPLIQVWIIRISLISLAQGLVLGLRIINLGLVVALWLYTTDQSAIVQSLVKLGIPFEWGLVLALALRYIPFVHDAYRTISDAQQARGLNLAQGSGLRRSRLMLPIFISMIISSLRASDQIAIALQARGFGARGTRRTYLGELRLAPLDYALLLVLLMLVAVLYLNLRYGFAGQPLGGW